MKIKINGRKVVDTQTPDQARIQNGFTNLFLRTIRTSALTLSAQRVKVLEKKLEAAANFEAGQIVDVIDSIIGQSKASIDWKQLAGSGTQYDLTGLQQIGKVTWAPLNHKYARAKEKRRKPGGFFRNSGRMQNYFRRYGKSVINGRMGGVKINIDTKGFNKDSRKTMPIWDENTSIVLKDFVGRIKVNIFPNVNPILSTMLSANGWSSRDGKDFEKSLFKGSAQRYKLTNPKGPYRPLFTPVILYFTAIRIPGKVAYTLKKYLNLSSVNVR